MLSGTPRAALSWPWTATAPRSRDSGDIGALAGKVLIFPDLNSAAIAYRLLAKIGGGETLGPILTGLSRPAHLLARGAEVEEIVNLTAIAVVDAQETGIGEPVQEASPVGLGE
jgi:malate dehydrogenase (oxaloacetate-decarboxylating)(NADP+)